ncbi:hypothetical protein LEMLEM_LOCUS27779 [Lemmus lemmus]
MMLRTRSTLDVHLGGVPATQRCINTNVHFALDWKNAEEVGPWLPGRGGSLWDSGTKARELEAGLPGATVIEPGSCSGPEGTTLLPPDAAGASQPWRGSSGRPRCLPIAAAEPRVASAPQPPREARAAGSHRSSLPIGWPVRRRSRPAAPLAEAVAVPLPRSPAAADITRPEAAAPPGSAPQPPRGRGAAAVPGGEWCAPCRPLPAASAAAPQPSWPRRDADPRIGRAAGRRAEARRR